MHGIARRASHTIVSENGPQPEPRLRPRKRRQPPEYPCWQRRSLWAAATGRAENLHRIVRPASLDSRLANAATGTRARIVAPAAWPSVRLLPAGLERRLRPAMLRGQIVQALRVRQA